MKADERLRLAHERRLSIEAMWADGLTPQEMADVLGSTANSIKVEMHNMRRLGYDLPYRQARAGAQS